MRQVLSGQAHLLQTAAALMSDLHPKLFMLGASGRIRFIDYGASLLPGTDFRIAEDRLHVLALIRLLVQAFAPDEQAEFDNPRAFHASPAQLQQRVDRSPGLQRCRRQVPALRAFLEPGAIVDAGRFVDPACYLQAAASISGRPRLGLLARAVIREYRDRIRRA